MYTVVAQRLLPLGPERIWEFLTSRALLARWFADFDRFEQGAGFRADFGDGDFFSGRINEWAPDIALAVSWKFMAMGPEYDVRFSLLRRKLGTELSVVDRGAITVEEAECLRVGWSEFLMRLGRTIEYDEPARFSWRKIVNLQGLSGDADDRLWEAIRRPEWYRETFGDVVVSVERDAPQQVLLQFGAGGWPASTDVRLERRSVNGTRYLFMWHEGWARLPGRQGAKERRQVVEKWVAGLSALGLR